MLIDDYINSLVTYMYHTCLPVFRTGNSLAAW